MARYFLIQSLVGNLAIVDFMLLEIIFSENAGIRARSLHSNAAP